MSRLPLQLKREIFWVNWKCYESLFVNIIGQLIFRYIQQYVLPCETIHWRVLDGIFTKTLMAYRNIHCAIHVFMFCVVLRIYALLLWKFQQNCHPCRMIAIASKRQKRQENCCSSRCYSMFSSTGIVPTLPALWQNIMWVYSIPSTMARRQLELLAWLEWVVTWTNIEPCKDYYHWKTYPSYTYRK